MYVYEQNYILSRKKNNNSNSAPEHAMDKIQNQQIEQKKTKTFTNPFFQFHFCYQIISKNVLIKTQSHKYATVQTV